MDDAVPLIASWRDLHTFAIHRHGDIGALEDACTAAVLSSGNLALQKDMAGLPHAVQTSCRLLDEHQVPVPHELVKLIRVSSGRR